MSVSVAGVKVKRGEKGFGFYKICTLANGGDLKLPIHVVAGKEEGPRFTAIAAAHGYEILGPGVIRKFIENLDPNELKGEFVGVPVANPIAFHMETRCSWIDSLWGDSGNMNRLWPGRDDGWITERMTYTMAEEIFPGSEAVVDLHGTTPKLALSYGYLGKQNTREEEFSKAYGNEILLDTQPEEIEKKKQWGTSKDYLRSEGILTYSTEIGPFYGLQGDNPGREESVRTVPEVGVTGLTNLSKFLGMLDGELELPERQVVIKPELNLRPSHGGFLESEFNIKDLGRVVDKGTVLGRMINPYTFETMEEIEAPFDKSILMATSFQEPYTKVNPGDYGYIIGDWENHITIDNT